MRVATIRATWGVMSGGTAGKDAAGLTVVETKGPFLEVLPHPEGHDILEFQKRCDDPPEPPELEDPADLPFNIADLVGLLGEEIRDPLGRGASIPLEFSGVILRCQSCRRTGAKRVKS